jgi:DNA topoisomerase I
MKLMIVESPNKVEKLSGILGDGWTVAASYGHIRDLPKEGNEEVVGISLEDFSPRYELVERAEKNTVPKLQRLVAQADEGVWLATDPDREGEAISWHLKEVLRLTEARYQRITFQSITEAAVLGAIKAPRRIDYQLVKAQEGRRVTDRLIGYPGSELLREKTGNRHISAGRVQSPAVRLLAERERQIQTFKPTNHFGAEVEFEGWKAKWDTQPFLKDDAEYVLDAALAERAASCRSFRVLEAETKPKRKSPPPPFRTVTLMQGASVALKFGPKKTAELAQKLFEAGHITYHRVDSQNFPADVLAEIRAFSAERGWPLPDKPRTWKEKDSAQEGHEAIRPTHLDVADAGDTDDERALYKLIRIRAIVSQLAEAKYDVTTVRLSCEQNGETFVFNARGAKCVEPGFEAVFASDVTDTDEAEKKAEEGESGQVPPLNAGAAVVAVDGRVLSLKTTAPKRYKAASLLQKLENMGIGRPSTYASIMSTIVERGYATEEKELLHCTQLGMTLVVALIRNKVCFIEYEYTRNLEDELDEIAQGRAEYVAVMQRVNERVQADIKRARADESTNTAPRYECPECSKLLRQIKGPKGLFWGCSGFDDGCRYSVPDDAGKPGAKPPEYACPECKKPLRRIKSANGFFWGCSGYSDGCKVAFPDENGKPGKRAPAPTVSAHKCTACGSGLINRKKPGQYNFWACSNRACDKTYDDRAGKPVERRAKAKA